MIPVSFDYVAPATLEEAVAKLAGQGNATVLAGGQSLIPVLAARQRTPGLLVDLGKIASLRGIQPHGSALRIGAMTTLDAIQASAAVADKYPALADAVATSGDPQTRNRGTLGGALADADPSDDVTAAVIALGATIHTTGAEGSRTIAAENFVTGPHATALQPGEIITAVDFPAASAGKGSAYVQFTDPGSGYAVCGVAALVKLDAGRKVTTCHLALTGAAEHPARLREVETWLKGKPPTPENLSRAGAMVTEAGLAFRTDLAASAEYRAQLATVLVERALARAAGRGTS